ncbi:bifunctional folylpolyglutamate synthase/dihydrofolate synthase [Virgibacillus ihumii]|uniref:bifunctional folylpolyglutamate synthase/dihydrofolate synthase n=1 Tax=Virgibacillus ihumii TaxID=2686091 RepID=UPI00157D8CAF|nr:Mur ligase family protein [Virgibacillus ihumii]
MFKDIQQVEDFFDKRRMYGMKPGLDRIRKLLHMLGNPQHEVKAIHVAGTNGKGSTVYYLKNALTANGYNVGMFTSPSLEGITGHIIKNDATLPEADFLYIMNNILPFIEKLDQEQNHPTEFEIITVAAFVYFAENVEIALIEAGMGGRMDTTNCFIPMLSVITNVEEDHMAFLGNTKSSIAYHKAGIIKEAKPVIVGEMDMEAMEVIQKEAIDKKAPVYQFLRDFHYLIKEKSNSSTTFEWFSDSKFRLRVTLNMDGKHQVKNASLVIMALILLEEIGYELDWQKCLYGITRTVIPGRYEHIHSSMVLDGAHNPAGVKAFIRTLSKDDTVNKHLIFAAFRDKELDKMLGLLCGYFTSVTLTTFDHPRAASCNELLTAAPQGNIKVMKDWKEAVDFIPESVSGSCWYVTGSLKFIANVRNYVQYKRKHRPKERYI